MRAAQGLQAVRGLVEKPGLVRRAKVGGEAAPRLVEKRRHRPQVRSDRAEFIRAVEVIALRAAKDAVDIDLDARFLLSSGEAAVGDGLIERLQAGQSIGTMRRRLAQMIKQPRMRHPKRLGMVLLQLQEQSIRAPTDERPREKFEVASLKFEVEESGSVRVMSSICSRSCRANFHC